jgi:hypothetical protein
MKYVIDFLLNVPTQVCNAKYVKLSIRREPLIYSFFIILRGLVSIDIFYTFHLLNFIIKVKLKIAITSRIRAKKKITVVQAILVKLLS